MRGLGFVSLVLAGLALAMLSACSHPPDLPLRWEVLTDDALLNRADLVVVGSSTVEIKSPPKPLNWTRMPGVRSIVLAQSRIRVERVLKGKWDAPDLRAFYWAGGEVYFGPEYHSAAGQTRAIHYLAKRGNQVRYVVDVAPSTTRIPWRATSASRSKSATDPTEAVVALLLSPDPASLDSDFGVELTGAVSRAVEIGGAYRSLPYLTRLLGHPNANVQVAVCKVLADSLFLGQATCLQELASRLGSSELKDLADRDRQLQIKLKRLLLSGSDLSSYSVLPPERGRLDVLQLLSLHPDAVVRAEARGRLAREEQTTR